MYELFGRYFWILLVLSIVNSARQLWGSTAAVSEKDPTLAEGRRRLAVAYAVVFNLPFLVMGYGIMSGRVDDMFAYFHPRSGPPFAIAWIATTWIVYVPLVAWVLFGNGATVLARHFTVAGDAKTGTMRMYAGLSMVFVITLSAVMLTW